MRSRKFYKPYNETLLQIGTIMDENQVEETENIDINVRVVVGFFTIVATTGFVAGACHEIGKDSMIAAKKKIKSLREERALKKAAKTEN